MYKISKDGSLTGNNVHMNIEPAAAWTLSSLLHNLNQPKPDSFLNVHDSGNQGAPKQPSYCLGDYGFSPYALKYRKKKF